jgi:hypothetical protein
VVPWTIWDVRGCCNWVEACIFDVLMERPEIGGFEGDGRDAYIKLPYGASSVDMIGGEEYPLPE